MALKKPLSYKVMASKNACIFLWFVMCVCVCVCVCVSISMYIYMYIYMRYYGQVKKHENVSAVSNLVVGKDKLFGFFGDVM